MDVVFRLLRRLKVEIFWIESQEMFFTQSTTVSMPATILRFLRTWYLIFFSASAWMILLKRKQQDEQLNIRYSGNSRNRKHIPSTCMVRTAQAQVQGSYHQITVKSLPPEQNQYKSSRVEKKRVTESLRWAPNRRPECRRLCGKTLSGLLHLRYRQHRFSRMEFEYQRLDLLLNTMPSLVVDYSNKKWDH